MAVALSTYDMFRFTPVADAEQIQRSLEDERYPMSTPHDRPQLIFLLCEYRDQGLSDTHQVRYCIFGRIVLG